MGMKRRLASMALGLLAVAGHAEPGAITIDQSRRGPTIHPHMYGIFLEEINHGVDGGLYAELIRNRGFEDARPPEGYTLRNGRWVDAHGARAGFDRFGYTTNGVPFWSLIREGGAEGEAILERSGGVSEASAYCVRLETANPAAGRIGIANHGFFGIGVKAGESYNLSLYARGQGTLAVQLETTDGLPLCEPAVFAVADDTWQPFAATLHAHQTEAKARLAILAQTPGAVRLDFVSLFPANTWQDRHGGLRADLAQLIADLQPRFVRFPGGCIVEGGTIETAYNWKHTVGPAEQRRETWGPWMTRRTQGMGLHEVLQFCEDLGAEPLWVGFAGQTCIFREREHVPMNEMGWVRDNFLDLVEYANGPADSTWGRRRAEAGHPAPFHLKYIEIGNENQGPEYGERYRFIHDALHGRYPDLHYLADLSWTSRQSLGNAHFDIEDRHYYNATRWFATRFHTYDDRDRSLPPLYLGELAVTSGDAGPLRGNLRAALAEAIYLLGCERNADTVHMVSYAPLLGHVEGRTELVDAPPPWHAMIYFDNLNAFGTASYHLWKLLGNHVPTYTVHTEVTLADNGPQPITGAVGVGTWGTAADFTNVRVERNGQTLYTSDFSTGADNWITESGRWTVAENAYQQPRPRNALSWVGDESWSNYSLSLRARKRAGGEGFLIVFGKQGENQFWWNLGGWGNSQHALEYNQTPVGTGVPGTIETDRWYDVKITLNNRRIQCWLDNTLVHNVTAPVEETFFASAGIDTSTGDLLLRAVNNSPNPFPASLDLHGLQPQFATATTLTAPNPEDNNSLEHPLRVAPQTSPIPWDPNSPSHTFPPHSFTLLRIPTR
jgi:alpha-L-arabinofuranosidase